MITNVKFYNKNDGEIFVGMLIGILCGLICGVVAWEVGILFGLLAGFIFSFCMGGLAMENFKIGIISGFVGMVVCLLINFREAFPFIVGFYPILFLVIGILVLVELLFFLNKVKPKKKEDKFWFTIRRKLEALFEVIFGLGIVGIVYVIIRDLSININI